MWIIDILVILNSNEWVCFGDMVILFGFCFYFEIGSWLLVNVLSNGLCGLWCVFVLLNE